MDTDISKFGRVDDRTDGQGPDVVVPSITVPAPAPPAPAPDPMEAMRQMMTELMAPMQTSLRELTEENARLREQVEKKEKVEFAENVPFHLRSDDPLVPVGDDRFGRRVVLATAAATPDFVRREIPHAQGRIVDAGGLVRNTMEKIMGADDGREDV